MTEQESTIKGMLSGPLSRRAMLKGGLVASSAAFLAACGAAQTSSAPPESAAPATAAPGSDAPATEAPTVAPVSYAGVTLQAIPAVIQSRHSSSGSTPGRPRPAATPCSRTSRSMRSRSRSPA